MPPSRDVTAIATVPHKLHGHAHQNTAQQKMRSTHQHRPFNVQRNIAPFSFLFCWTWKAVCLKPYQNAGLPHIIQSEITWKTPLPCERVVSLIWQSCFSNLYLICLMHSANLSSISVIDEAISFKMEAISSRIKHADNDGARGSIRHQMQDASPPCRIVMKEALRLIPELSWDQVAWGWATKYFVKIICFELPNPLPKAWKEFPWLSAQHCHSVSWLKISCILRRRLIWFLILKRTWISWVLLHRCVNNKHSKA